jgi:hypothetical protein
VHLDLEALHTQLTIDDFLYLPHISRISQATVKKDIMDMEEEPQNFDMQLGFGAPSRSGSRTPHRIARKQAPQDTVKQFWEQFNTKYPGKVFTVLPDNPYARSKAAQLPKGIIQGHDAVKSYEQAKAECVVAVERVVRECERINQKYTDPHFDIEFDLKTGKRNYLDGLNERNTEMRPKGVKRVTVRIQFCSSIDKRFRRMVEFISPTGYLRSPSVLHQRAHGRRCASRPGWRLLAHGCPLYNGQQRGFDQ